MARFPIKLLKDKNQHPFFPFNTLDSVLVNGTNKTLKDLLDNIYTEDEINTMLADLLSIFEVFTSVEQLPRIAREGSVAVVYNGVIYTMYFYYSGSWHALTQKGDKGDNGSPGDAGPYFLPNVDANGNISWTNNGDLPNPATRNIKGPKGDTGDTGPQGPQGVPGPQGTGVNILGSYDTLVELKEEHPTGNIGDAYLVQGHLYVWSETEIDWIDVGNIQGPQGQTGPAGQNGADGAAGPGLSQGGTVGQIPIKQSSTDYDTAWGDITIPTVAASNGTETYLMGVTNASSGNKTNAINNTNLKFKNTNNGTSELLIDGTRKVVTDLFFSID